MAEPREPAGKRGRGSRSVKLEASSVCFLPLFRQDCKRTLLVFNDPQQKDTVLAVFLYNSWWPVEDLVKTADLSREGLIQVQTFGERIVLFVLNYIIFGMQERTSTWDAVFMPHSEKEQAKIFWRNGEAAAFYTIKAKGSLCDGHSGQCYLLPVLDTAFVRKKFRRRGLGTAMLQDFCQTFATEEALGISCPISAEMYQVCQRFLDTRPEEQARLWEVEGPGDWSQRTSVWLTIQLAQNLPKKDDLTCRAETSRDDESGQLGDSQRNERAILVPNIRVPPGRAEKLKVDCEEPLGSQRGVEERVSRRGEELQCEKAKRGVRRGGPTEGRAPKQIKEESYDQGSHS
uniref:protein FAM169B-like n=1 Tax=Euleptes europaea TaxID=460621 RepID=UPI00254156FD|nr:protein FAM169B-like [Euleptes europaea]